MRYPRSIVEIMGDIVSKLPDSKDRQGQTLLDRMHASNSTIHTIHYMYGHPLELVGRLQAKTQDPGNEDTMTGGKWDMWPVVMLFTDIAEQWDGGNSGYCGLVTLQMVIAMITDRDLLAAERREKNFQPILQPIYETLMAAISRCGELVVYGQKQLPHTKYDRYYWGKTGLYGNSGNVFNDNIDAIEIQNLILTINNT